MSETLFVFLAAVFEVVFRVSFACRDLEGMGGCPQAHHWSSALEIVRDVLHLFIGQVEEAGENDHQVGVLESFEALDVGGPGFDVSVLINSEQHGGFETLVLGKDAGEGGTGFLGAIFMIRGDEDEVFAFAGAFTTEVSDLPERRENQGEKEEKVFHG
jgi:hypothetical protein